MNKRQAEQDGYIFHGAFSHNKEEVKSRAAELRKMGNKAIVVNVPPSKYSRGYHGMGYSIYWIENEANKTACQIKLLTNKILQAEHEIAKALAVLEEKRNEIEAIKLEIERR